MPIKLPGFLKNFSGVDAKSRIFIVLIAIVAVGFLIFIGTRFMQGGAGAIGPSKIAQAPAGLQTVPGGKMTPEFYRAVTQANVQAAQQAQISGGSAVPTLLNVPTEHPGQTGCCNSDNVDVAVSINNLVKTGKLSQEDSEKLLALSKSNVPFEEFAVALNDLVRQGKLSPEEARKLLDSYKKQHQNHLISQNTNMIDSLVKSGQLPLETANQLVMLQKNGISTADYAKELDRLVKEGKISPKVAAQLLEQYTQQQTQEQTKAAIFELQQMTKLGQISGDATTVLTDLQNHNASVEEYGDALNRLVAQGKMTPEVAAKLLEQYKKQHGLGGISAAMSEVISQAQVAESQCRILMGQLIQSKKLSPAEAKVISDKCQKLSAIKKELQQLSDLQKKGVPVADFFEALKRVVKAGLLTPEQATELLKEYRTIVATKTGAPTPAPLANVPGSDEFAKLQQRLQIQQQPEEATSVVEGQEFEVITAEANAEADQEKRQRIQLMRDAMSAQAQQLITAWQPVTMQHQGSTEDPSKLLGKSKQAGQSGEESEGSKSGAVEKGNVVIKAGTILFAVLDTAVNSDFPDSPVMATIIEGEFKGGKVLGKLAVATASTVQSLNQDKVTLTFNLMTMDAWHQSKVVNAFGIDPDTARTALASNVDYHYLKRYGALFAGSFLSGYAEAVAESGSQTTVSTVGTTTTNPKMSPNNKIAVGLGKVGNALASAVQNNVNIPPTVVVNSGVGLGILFMADVT